MAGKFGLGRGLADLNSEMGAIPDISILTGMERVVVKQIPLAEIGTNPGQPRKTFSEAELADLAASIREKGVLQPILLRATPGAATAYEIVAGERRYRAAKMAGLSQIPALVKNLSDENAMEIALIENVQRENLNPVEEGAAYKNLMQECGYSLADVSRLIGKSESYIRNMMRIDTLPASVKEMVADGKLSASHARTIAVAENPEQLAREIVAGNMSVADVSRRVKDGARNANSRGFKNTGLDTDVRVSMEKDISAALGVPAKIVERRGGAGQVVLSFANRIQMNELISRLTK